MLAARGLTKRFGGLTALAGVDLEVRAGEIHALLGGNGAGKSTLIKVLSGVLRPDAGTLELGGAPVAPRSPLAARALGIATIHQETDLVPTLSLADNLMLGDEPRSAFGISRRRLEAAARAALVPLCGEVDVRRMAGDSPVALRQLVCIARALRLDARLLILDEPTSSLDPHEVERVLEVVRAVAARGVAVLFVSHFLDQVFALCSRATVLRDGARVATTDLAGLSRAALIEQMLGALPAVPAATRPEPAGGAPLLAARGVGRRGAIAPFDLELRAGEVVGLAGLLGSGRSELVRALFGAEPADSGAFAWRGRALRVAAPRDAVSAGIAFCPEDRGREGIFPSLSVRDNLCALARLRGGFWVSRKRSEELARALVRELGIKVHDLAQPAATLSGGNQQKVVLARWLAQAPLLLILDEPTRGIDVGAKAEVERLVLAARERGMAVIFVSAELAEVVRVSDRVLVLAERRVVAELRRGEASEAGIVAAIAAAGGHA